ncbi:MAG: AmmeMemoRadiSam system protein B [Acidobacteria bacterium]|nr:AmmeMemoRadiSam system protein B [Acidobacteriota bacterium]
MVRAPAVAGRFYPGEPEVLEGLVARLLINTSAEEPQRAIALLAPHAGWVYSGAVAGAVYACARIPDRVVLLGPNHTGLGPPLSLWDRGAWEYPGERVRVDEEMAKALKDSCADLIPDQSAHRYEHCLEVQLPFLRARSGNLRITPVVVGTTRLDLLKVLAGGLADAIRKIREEVLIVISSDMTHYEPAGVAEKKDRLAVAAMEAVDAEALYRVVRHEGISMCGYAPAVAGLLAGHELGARVGRLIRYSHSGEVSGDSNSVVGYAGMTFS